MDHELLRIDVDQQQKRVTARRTARAVTSAAAVLRMVEDARAALNGLARQHYAISIDLTDAPLAVESRYADAFAALRRELTAGFQRALFVVGTKMGYLQVQRFIREEKLPAQVVYDNDEASRAT